MMWRGCQWPRWWPPPPGYAPEPDAEGEGVVQDPVDNPPPPGYAPEPDAECEGVV